MTIKTYTSNLDGKNLRIGIVEARFNKNICYNLLTTCLTELKNLGVQNKNIVHITVPGALEIPVILQKLAITKLYDALIAVGAIIRGETYHFELVANESAAGINRVALDTNTPIVNAILTTENSGQTKMRMAIKGINAARVAIEMANLIITLKNNSMDCL